tara:strand:+ start:417 stop:1193 length:777 start_codon:yes stop_codon:yes gene_type:complete
MNYHFIKGSKKGLLLFIHGNSSSSEIFNDIIESKKIAQSILLVDLPGHGKSMNTQDQLNDFSISSYSEKITALIKKFDNEILLIGNSLGGHIAIEIASDIPQLKGLVIFGTPPLKKPINFSEAYMPLPESQTFLNEFPTDIEIQEAANAAIYNINLAEEIIKIFKKANPEVRKAYAIDMTEGRLQNEFEIFTNLDIPKYIIAGSHDLSINFNYLKLVANSCRNTCELIVFQNCGHYPSHEKPAEFLNTIQSIANKVFK